MCVEVSFFLSYCMSHVSTETLLKQHAKVLQMGCGLLRALSYDAECCVRLKTKAVSVVVDSIRRNPRKVDVMIEGR